MPFGFLKRFIPALRRVTVPNTPEVLEPFRTTEDEIIYGGAEFTCASSNVDAFRYEYDEQRLIVRFMWGAEYEYIGVSEEIVRKGLKTASPGRWVWDELRGTYPYNKVGEGNTARRKPPRVIRKVPTPMPQRPE